MQNRRTSRNISNDGAGMFMATGLLTGLKRNLANIYPGYLFRAEELYPEVACGELVVLVMRI
jgi:hypothetical protein